MRVCPKCSSTRVVIKNKDGTCIYECWDCNKSYVDTWVKRLVKKIFNS